MEVLLQTAKCGECSSDEILWVSMNKALLLCNDCACVHIEMGHHVSIVKPVSSTWSTSEIQFLQALCSTSNNIWEYFLSDTQGGKTGRRKPEPTDPIYPTKADFIRAKHQHFLFVFRHGKIDQSNGKSDQDEDVSEQLHAVVRSSNLETSLRLIASGADPNFFHTEKGLSTLHVAAMNGQLLQAELLVMYGADLGMVDAAGRTALDIAQEAGHTELAARLVELQYSVTDRFSKYLCEKLPDHKASQHFLIPKVESLTHSAKESNKKMQKLSNELFEELVMDVYDELDRRDLERVWKALHAYKSADINFPSPSLPPIKELSGNRNALRRRLAKLSPTEFALLLVDLLREVKLRISAEKLTTAYSDDEPLYDRVASEDYFPIDSGTPHFYSEPQDTIGSTHSFANVRALSQEAAVHIQQQLAASDVKMEARWKSVEQQIKSLQETVEKLAKDNLVLKSSALPPPKPPALLPKFTGRISRSPELVYSKPVDELPPAVTHRSGKSSRPISMFEPRKSASQPLPSNTEVTKLTNAITASVNDLKNLVDAGKSAELPGAADRVVKAALTVLGTLNSFAPDPSLQSALFKLSQSLATFQSTCKELTPGLSSTDAQCIMRKLLHPCAYEVLVATKQIVNYFQTQNM